MKHPTRKSKQQKWLVLSIALGALLLPQCGLIVGDLPAATQGVSNAGGGQGGGSAGGFAGNSTQGGSNSTSGGSANSGNGGSTGVGGFATGANAGTDAGGAAGSPVVIIIGNGGSGGVTSTGDAGGAGGCDPCDCDGDGALNDSCNVGGAPADCDDVNKFVKPGQSAYFVVPANQEIGFDYDCSGNIERAYTTFLKCPLVAGATCTGQGFAEPLPACGAQGDWIECQASALTCGPSVLESKTMPCH